MKLSWATRWPVTLGAAIASAAFLLPAVAPASASTTPQITSNSTQLRYVIYGIPTHSITTLAGKTSNTPPGSVAALFESSFPFKTAPHQVASETLSPSSSGAASYSFKVGPTVASQFVVKIEYEGSVLAETKVQTVYVVSGRAIAALRAKCVRPYCSVTFTYFRFLPPVVSKYELTKRFYDYLGIDWSRTSKNPPPPKWMSLRQGWKVSASTPVPNAKNEYQTMFSFSFKILASGIAWEADTCNIDTESKDGFGLPSSTGCGDPTIPAHPGYLG